MNVVNCSMVLLHLGNSKLVPKMYPQFDDSRMIKSFPVWFQAGVTKRRRLSWLTNSALVYEPKGGLREWVAGLQPMSTAVRTQETK